MMNQHLKILKKKRIKKEKTDLKGNKKPIHWLYTPLLQAETHNTKKHEVQFYLRYGGLLK